jgi:cytochrome c2
MRSIFFLLLTVASFWVLFLGVREKPARMDPPAHVHNPAAGGSGDNVRAEAATSVRFDRASKGYTVFKARACQTCHGPEATGSRMGPSLAEVRLHYDRASLAAYLADPNAFIENDERLLEMQSRYPRIEMPAYPDLSEGDLEALLTFLLEPEVR